MPPGSSVLGPMAGASQKAICQTGSSLNLRSKRSIICGCPQLSASRNSHSCYFHTFLLSDRSLQVFDVNSPNASLCWINRSIVGPLFPSKGLCILQVDHPMGFFGADRPGWAPKIWSIFSSLLNTAVAPVCSPPGFQHQFKDLETRTELAIPILLTLFFCKDEVQLRSMPALLAPALCREFRLTCLCSLTAGAHCQVRTCSTQDAGFCFRVMARTSHLVILEFTFGISILCIFPATPVVEQCVYFYPCWFIVLNIALNTVIWWYFPVYKYFRDLSCSPNIDPKPYWMAQLRVWFGTLETKVVEFGEMKRKYFSYVLAIYLCGLFCSVSNYILTAPFLVFEMVAE